MTNSVVFWGMILIFSSFISPYSLVFAQNITSIISQSLFDEMLKHRNDPFCFANVSYTYDSFVAAANIFREFGTTGDNETRKREVAAFFGFTSHLTTAGGPNSTDGPYAWGYCFLQQEQPNPLIQCDTRTSQQWPCVPGQRYYSRGPMQLSYNYNYGPAGQAIGIDLLRNPDLVATNATIAFKTAIWFWMTPSPPNPSCHDVITGQWTPSTADLAAGRAPGYGEIINIVRGSTECGQGESNEEMLDSIGFYKRYCDMFEIGYGNNLDCAYNRTNLIPRVSIQLLSCSISVMNNLVYQ